MVGTVVRQPGADLVLEDHLGPDQRPVEVDHLLQAGRLEIDVVELGRDNGVGHASAPEVAGVKVMIQLGAEVFQSSGTASADAAAPNT